MHPDNQNPYSFIMSPGPAPKRHFLRLRPNTFWGRIILLVGGAATLIIVTIIILSAVSKSSSVNTADLIGLVQTQQELVRVATQGQNATSKNVRDLSITVRLSVDTNRLQLLDYLKNNKQKLSDKQLNIKRNTDTDSRLETARQNNAFNTVFAQTLQDSLTAYSAEIESTNSRSTGAKEKKLLAQMAAATALLLKQVPSQESIQAGS